MKQTYFCGKKSLLINSSSTIEDVKNNIKKIGPFNISSKYYTFLSKKNVNNLKEKSFLVSLRSFGKSFILFITRINDKKYCIFINKKNESMNIVQFPFINDIYDGTIFDGELVKNNNNKWIYIINDIAYYKGKNLITENFINRCSIIQNLLNNEFKNNDDNLFIIQKQFFTYSKINDLVTTYQKSLNYKHSGLYFKNTNNFSDNYLFIFPECRTDSKILNNGVTIDNQKVIIENNNNENNNNENNNRKNISNEEDLFKDTEYIGTEMNNSNNITNNNSTNNYIKNNLEPKQKLDKITCKFLINPTNLPDVYELYCNSSNNKVEKHSYAAVPDMDTSFLLKELINFNNIEDDIMHKINNHQDSYVECNYHKNFKKWIPFKKTDSMDNINTINQTQIILDSL